MNAPVSVHQAQPVSNDHVAPAARRHSQLIDQVVRGRSCPILQIGIDDVTYLEPAIEVAVIDLHTESA